MKKTLLITLILLASLAVAETGKNSAAYSQRPDEKAPQLELETYQFGLLKRGPKWTGGNSPEIQKIQEGHMANINKMARAGKLLAAGPMGDDGEIRGVFIFKASSLNEARSLAAEDPAIKAGRLTLELHDWLGPKSIGAKLQEELKTNPNPKYTMTKYYLTLLKRSPKRTDFALPESQKLITDHISNAKRMMAARTFVAAGPFDEKGDLRGIFVIAAGSLEEAQTIADADPAVKAGLLTAEIHPWYVAKEVWP